MSHRVAFYQGMHCLRRSTQYLGTGVQHYLVIWTIDHLPAKWTVSYLLFQYVRENPPERTLKNSK